MEQVNFQPLDVFKKPMKILAFGPQNAGKTWNGIDLAIGIIMEEYGYTDIDDCWKHLAVVDSEARRAILVLRKKGAVGKGVKYQELKAPYHIQKLTDLQAQFDLIDEVCVVLYDSLTHYWAKKGGVLDEKNKLDLKGGNSYTNWQTFSGQFNEAMDLLLDSPKHIICTSRSKNDTTLEKNDKGKMAPITYGLKPMLRDDIEYDFDLVFNVDKESHALIVDKGVPDCKPIYNDVTFETGRELYQLFNAGAVIKDRTADDYMESIRKLAKQHNMVNFMQITLKGNRLDGLNVDELKQLEEILIKEIKKTQTKITAKPKK